ncbi:MAG: CHAT domain-containing protein [Chloroflexi bacterium]|nr:CHAT domain-containing protein [Chloroflexota bacterium]
MARTAQEIQLDNLAALERDAAGYGADTDVPLKLRNRIIALRRELGLPLAAPSGETPNPSSAEAIKRANLAELERRATMYGADSDVPLLLRNRIISLRRELGLPPVNLPSPEPWTASPAPAGDEALVIQLLQPPEGGAPLAQVTQSPQGGESAPQTLVLPYSEAELEAVLKGLGKPFGPLTATKLKPEITAVLQAHNLSDGKFLLKQIYPRVGKKLYDSLFAGDIGKMLFAARLAKGATDGAGGGVPPLSSPRHTPGMIPGEQDIIGAPKSLPVRLVIDANSPTLAAYPWEMVYNDQALLADGVIDLIRYIPYPNPPKSLKIDLPLRVLIVSPRPKNLASLPPYAEPATVMQTLQGQLSAEQVTVTRLPKPTRRGLLAYLRQHPVHLLHFDGHGIYGKLCPVCSQAHTPNSKKCVNEACNYPLAEEPAQGYLALENAQQQANYISADVFANTILAGSAVQAVVLSACQSGLGRQVNLFSGVAPALIQRGIPAVIAMQLAIGVKPAIAFVRDFYKTLAQFKPLVAAVREGRRTLYDDASNPQTWFVPVLYLRSKDSEGQLFKTT